MRYFVATYMQKPDGKYNEVITIENRIKNKVMQTATVILDFKDRKIVKSRFQAEMPDPTDFDKVCSFYQGHYPQIVEGLEIKYQVIGEVVAEVAAEIAESRIDHEAKNKIDQADADTGLDTINNDSVESDAD